MEDKYKEITGREMVKYYRPPQGKYSLENLEMAINLAIDRCILENILRDFLK